VAGEVSERRLQLAAVVRQYMATHPGQIEANVSILNVTLWLASRRSPGAAE